MAKQLSYPILREIFTRFQASDAAPKGELYHTNAYTLLVAVALSAQATDKGVNKATQDAVSAGANAAADARIWGKRG